MPSPDRIASPLVCARLSRGDSGRAAGLPPARPAAPNRRPCVSTPGEAAAMAKDARQKVSGRRRARPRADALGPRAAAVRSRRHRSRRAGHGVRHEHEPEQPAARHPAAPRLVPHRPHAQDRRGSARVLPPRARARAKREEHAGSPISTRTARATCATSPSSRSASTASRTPTATASPTSRAIVAEGFNDDPAWDVAGRHARATAAICSSACRRASTGCATRTATARSTRASPISEGYNIHPAFGGHGISGVTLGPDGRLYWEVGDMGLNVVDKTGRRWAYPNQGAVLRSNLDGSDFEVFATGIRNLAGVLLRRARQSDQRRQRRRPSGRDRAARLHPRRIRQRLALQLAVRQVHRREEQPLQRLDGRGDVQAALRRAGGAHHAAHRAVARGAVGHGLQPGHGAVGGVAQSLLRLELSRRGRQRARSTRSR